MGSDGRIHIWKKTALEEAWPSAVVMLEKIEAACYLTAYTDLLDGVEYIHLYSATGNIAWQDYGQDNGWHTRTPPRTKAETESFLKMLEFVRWLKANATVWEVWT
jgi:hypothetical protein